MAVAALMVTSCSSKVTDAEATDEGAAIKAKIENCTDPDSLAIYVQQAKEYAQKLVKEGNDSAAQAYLEEVTPVIQKQDPTMATVFDEIQMKADSVVASQIEKADSLKDATVDAAKQKASDVKDAAKDAADNVKDKAAAAGDAAKQKTADAIQSGADKLKGALGK